MKGIDFSGSPEQWKLLIAEQKKSGLSQAKFCEARGIPVKTFYSWAARLKREVSGSAFAPVVAKRDGDEPAAIRVLLRNGAEIHFMSIPEPKWFLELMRLGA